MRAFLMDLCEAWLCRFYISSPPCVRTPELMATASLLVLLLDVPVGRYRGTATFRSRALPPRPKNENIVGEKLP